MSKGHKNSKSRPWRVQLPWYQGMVALNYMQTIRTGMNGDTPKWERDDIDSIIKAFKRAGERTLAQLAEEERAAWQLRQR